MTESAKVKLKTMTVFVNHDLCCGGGTCRGVNEVFGVGSDAFTRLKGTDGEILPDEDDQYALATVPNRLWEAVEAASKACPGQCIIIEYVDERE